MRSTLGVGQVPFERCKAVDGVMNCVIALVLFPEHERTKRLSNRRLSEQRRRWWKAQRFHGLCKACRQECTGNQRKSFVRPTQNLRRLQKSPTVTHQRRTCRIPYDNRNSHKRTQLQTGGFGMALTGGTHEFGAVRLMTAGAKLGISFLRLRSEELHAAERPVV